MENEKTQPPQAGEGEAIYIASKTKHAAKWIALREQGYNIISTWIDEASAGQSPDRADLRRRCISEAAACTAMIVYAEEGDYLKGAFIEMGVAIANNKPVWLVGPVLPPSSVFTYGNKTFTASSVELALETITPKTTQPPQAGEGSDRYIHVPPHEGDLYEQFLQSRENYVPLKDRKQPPQAGEGEALSEAIAALQAIRNETTEQYPNNQSWEFIFKRASVALNRLTKTTQP